MQTASEQGSTHTAEPLPDRKPRGRGVALLALFVALCGVAVAGLVYWRTFYEPGPLTFRLVQVETRLQDLDQRVTAQAAALMRAEQQREAAPAPLAPSDVAPMLAPSDAAAALVAPEAAAALAPSGAAAPAAWHLAEVRYLLRMANHRLQLERDVRGALLLLGAADDSLERLDDPRFTPVRAHIAEERFALQALPGADVEGLFLALEVIKRDLDGIKPRAPAFVVAAATDKPVADGTLATLWAAVAELVRFRRLDTPAEALLLPEEALYLELNLRLMLERAQLAALRREQPVFDSSIREAQDWVARYLDPADLSVRRVSEGLAAVAPVELAAPLPDLSASLVALDAALSAAP